MEKELKNLELNVDENTHLPKSIVPVETAVPAFIGYTEKAFFDGKDLHSINAIQPLEINSFAEYEGIFGGAPEPASIEFQLNRNNSVISLKTEEYSFLYYSVKLFFENFGTTCLVVSVGNFSNEAGKVSKHQLMKGLSCLEKTDVPTLLVIPDAVKLSYGEAGELHAAMLHQSHKLKNRFALLDIVNGANRLDSAEKPLDNFRENLNTDSLSYGAAYYPWLITTWNPRISTSVLLSAKYFRDGLQVKDLSTLFSLNIIDVLNLSRSFSNREIKLKHADYRSMTRAESTAALANELYNFLKKLYDFISHEKYPDTSNPFVKLHLNFIAKGSEFHKLMERFFVLVAERQLPLDFRSFLKDFKPLTFPIRTLILHDRSKPRKRLSSRSLNAFVAEVEQLGRSFFDEIERIQLHFQELMREYDKTYNSIVRAVETHKVVVPPSGAVAGVYSQVDHTRGVWKAPADLHITSAVCPAVEVFQQDQQNMKADTEAGISINALLFLTLKGVKVQGAHTLAGCGREWAYINVRRFCIMVEQSINEAIHPFSFEPNNEVTWSRVITMVENFLGSLWKEGALKGSNPEEAYFVKLGIGETMTASDVENGLMILCVGLAPLKPAGFLVLSLSQKMFIN